MSNNRNKIGKFIGFLVSIALIFQMVFLSVGGIVSGKDIDSDAPMYVIPPPEPRLYTSEWLIMVYSAGDNNLEYHLMDDLDEMETIGSTQEVAIAAWMDRWDSGAGSGSTTPSIPGDDPSGGSGSSDDRSNNNWTGTKRFLIEQDQDRRDDLTGQTENDIFLWSPQEHIGEKNMGDPNSLVSFVNWATSWYPANKCALIISDHGGGGSGIDGVCWDWHTALDERLTPQELSSALSTITDSGINIDLLIFNACLQANFENYAEISYSLPQQSILLGSEEVMSYDGIPLHSDYGASILQWLTINYAASPSQLTTKIIDEYQMRFSASTNSFASYSAIDNSKINDLKGDLDTMAQILVSLTPIYISEIQGALDVVDKCDYHTQDPLNWIIDVNHFVHELKIRIPDADFQNSAQIVLDAISDCVIDEWHGSLHPNFAGLTIYFPDNIGTFLKYHDYYKNFNIASATHWDDFITQFYCGGDSIPPTITVNQATYGYYALDPGNVVNVDFDSGTTVLDYYNSVLDYAQYKVGTTGAWRNIFTSNEHLWNNDWHIAWWDLQEGENTVYIRCADLGGNDAEVTIVVKKDTSGPVPQGIPQEVTPGDKDWGNGDYMVYWSPAIDQYTTTTQYELQERVNSGTWQTISSTITATDYYITGRNIDGNFYDYRVRAQDTLGNWNGWSGTSDGITIDSIPPEITTPYNHELWEISNPEFVWNVPVDSGGGISGGSGVAGYEWYVDSGDISTTIKHIRRIPHQPPGDHIFYLRAIDNVGNAAPWASCAFHTKVGIFGHVWSDDASSYISGAIVGL